MIYYAFRNKTTGLQLQMCSQKPDQPLTEEAVRQFVMEAIQRTEDSGDNPVQEARYAEVHHGWVHSSLWEDMTPQELTDWVMDTEEMQEILTQCRGEIPGKIPADSVLEAWEMEEEEVGELNLSNLLLNLTITESDWR